VPEVTAEKGNARADAGRSPVAGNASAFLAARVVSAVVALATAPPLFAILGPHQFGLWALLLAAAGIAGLADLGLGSAQVREVAQATVTGEPRRARAAMALGLLLSTALALVLAAGILLGWSALANAFHLGDETDAARWAALLLVAALLVDSLAVPWRAALEGTQRMKPVAVIGGAAALVNGAAAVFLAALGAGLAGLGLAALAASLLRAALLWRSGRQSLAGMRPSLRAVGRAERRSLLGYGARVQATNVAAAVNADTDRLVLGAFFSPAVVAPFDLGSRLVAAMRIVPSYVLAALFPVIVGLHARGERELLDRLYLRTTRYLALFACLVAATLAVSADPLVALWIGQPLPLAATTIALLAPAYALSLTSGAAAALARAEGVPGRETRYAVLAAALNVALTIPLLIALGAVGVPLATALAILTATAYFFWHFHRASRRPLAPLVRATWKPFAAAALASFPTWAVLAVLPDPTGRSSALLAVGARAGLVLVLATVALWALRFFDAADRGAANALLCRARLLAPAPSAGGRAW
jgi:O-antigen/teichoic acid export membrane protein